MLAGDGILTKSEGGRFEGVYMCGIHGAVWLRSGRRRRRAGAVRGQKRILILDSARRDADSIGPNVRDLRPRAAQRATASSSSPTSSSSSSSPSAFASASTAPPAHRRPRHPPRVSPRRRRSLSLTRALALMHPSFESHYQLLSHVLLLFSLYREPPPNTSEAFSLRARSFA